jgi:hypothetical protein
MGVWSRTPPAARAGLHRRLQLLEKDHRLQRLGGVLGEHRRGESQFDSALQVDAASFDQAGL